MNDKELKEKMKEIIKEELKEDFDEKDFNEKWEIKTEEEKEFFSFVINIIDGINLTTHIIESNLKKIKENKKC